MILPIFKIIEHFLAKTAVWIPKEKKRLTTVVRSKLDRPACQVAKF